MNSIFVQLGKTGDVLSSLRFIHDEFKLTGERQNLLVAKQYASVADGVDYVTAVVWDGHWQDLHGAIRKAKREFQRVIVPSTYGKDFPIQHLAPSFQLDQALRARSTNDTTLILPRPTSSVELVREHMGGARCILLSDHSESSPFPHKEDLWKTLSFHFGPTHKIVRLSDIKLPNIKDFLALFDAADLIVTIDTAFLHLSAATTTPVIALATDKPERWHGSAWSKRFAFYCRYSDYEAQKEALVRAVDNIVNKRKPVQIDAVGTCSKHGYNLGMVLYENRLLAAYRYHPEPKAWRTELVIKDGLIEMNITIPEGLEEHSWEDARLFIHQNKLFMSYTLSVYPQQKCVVGYGELELKDGAWTLAKHLQPVYGKNDFTAIEKNFVFFEADGKLFAIYGSNPEQTVIQLNGETVTATYKSVPPKWAYGEVRGGAIVPYKNRLLRFFHSRVGDSHKHYEFRYHVGALLMEAAPPFKAVAISRYPIISGHEQWTQNCPHWKPNVVFPCGAVQDGDGWKLALGINDSACAIARIKPEHLNLVDYA